jgi:hypothetical protein
MMKYAILPYIIQLRLLIDSHFLFLFKTSNITLEDVLRWAEEIKQ